jgi:hypothetical protein
MVKAEFFPVWRNGYIASLVILCSRWMWVVSFTGRPLYPQGKIARSPLNERPGGCQNRSWLFGEENKCLPFAEIEPRLIGCPASCLVTVPISRKHNPGWTAIVKDTADRYRSRVDGFQLHRVDERTPIYACAKFPLCLLTAFLWPRLVLWTPLTYSSLFFFQKLIVAQIDKNRPLHPSPLQWT